MFICLRRRRVQDLERATWDRCGLPLTAVTLSREETSANQSTPLQRVGHVPNLTISNWSTHPLALDSRDTTSMTPDDEAAVAHAHDVALNQRVGPPAFQLSVDDA